MTIVILTTAFSSCKEEKKSTAIDKTDLDLSVNPAADFDNYANGGWKVKNPLPDDKSRFGTFDKLRDVAEKQQQALFDKVTTEKHEQGTVGQKIADLYNMGMDSVTIEKLGAEPLKPYLSEISAIKNIADVQTVISSQHISGNGTLFSFYASPDDKNSNWVIAQLYQGGLGLSDRDYYTNQDSRSKEIRDEYVKFVAKMFVLAGNDDAIATTKASKIMAIETRLANASMTRLETRDPVKTYNKMNLKGLTELSPSFDWNTFFTQIGAPGQEEINVGQPEFFKEISKMIAEIPVEDWKAYLEWNVINSSAGYLSSAFVDENFNFYGKVMKGQEKNRDRWKRVQGTVSNAMSEAVGQLYVAEYFPPQAKERMVKLVENLRISLGQRIDNLAWMSDETKAKAREKLATITVKIGYPDKWRDYSELKISKEDTYLDNVFRSWKFESAYNFSKINKAVDRTEWFMPPQMVNAYYNPSMNEIVFPAAILQPPFFYLDADDAVNYGAIGVVIGHEITHGFDDQGCQYDKDGNLNNWWTEEDGKRFEERTKILSNQYDQFIVLDTIHADGKLTIGENIADLGGLNISYQAYKSASKETASIDGFTPDQRFFLAYAHLWASNIRDKEILRLTKEDVHSLGRFRVLGPLRNLPQFYNAFNIKEGDYMYLNESERAVIW
jgi:putative endopeptidase